LSLPFDFGLEGLGSVLSRRRFPRSGDSSTTLAPGGLAGVDDATGLNASMGEDWEALSVGITCLGLVNAILRGDGSLREREATDTVVSVVLIAHPLTDVRGNAAATEFVVSSSVGASARDSTGGRRDGPPTGWGSRSAGVGTVLSGNSDWISPNLGGLEESSECNTGVRESKRPTICRDSLYERDKHQYLPRGELGACPAE